MKKSARITLVILAALSCVLSQPASAVYPPNNSGTDYIFDVTANSYFYGSTGYIRFNDWNYVGPNGAGATDFVVPGTTGFDASQLGQKQIVVTYGVDAAGVSNLDGLTPDLPRTVITEDLTTPMFGANMDGQVNFYRWGYTTPADSTFNNMQIDKNGNYFVAREDMAFGFYDYFVSTWADSSGGTQYPGSYDTALGWCGSVLNSNPNGLEKMAGQVTFDFAFDAYLADAPASSAGGGTQIVPDFVMRSYGNYRVDLNVGGVSTIYTGSAVINNTSPITAELDPAYQNKVSFLGAGVVPKGVWVTADSYNTDGSKKLNPDGTWQVTVASGFSLCVPGTDAAVRASDGAHCWQNSYAGYGFLMRADGSRLLYEIAGTAGEIGAGHSNYVATDAAAYASLAAVPVPGAIWLFGSGLLALVGWTRARRRA
jgi:hypothetical protein